MSQGEKASRRTTQVPVWMVLVLFVFMALLVGPTIGGRLYEGYNKGPDVHLTTQPITSLPEGIYVINWQESEKGVYRYVLTSISDAEPQIYPVRFEKQLPHAFEITLENDVMKIEPRKVRVNININHADEAPKGPVT